MYTLTEVTAMLREPLFLKLCAAVRAIGDAFAVCENPGLAFSGGKDSTVLWHMIRTFYPERAKDLHIIFGNTGCEYPESMKFAQKLGQEWGGDRFHETRPEKTEKEGLKYAAQREVLDWLIDTGRVGEVLKADGKLKTKEVPSCLKRQLNTSSGPHSPLSGKWGERLS